MVVKAMLSLPLLMLFLILSLIVEAQHFISPKYQPTMIPGPYGGDSLWPLGSSQLIAFQASWDEYRIEFWQQGVEGSSTKLSSNIVYSQSSGDDLSQSFYWTVQTYELQLSDSPVFFFWLRDSNSDAQKSSAYFNITVETPSSSSSTISASRKTSTGTIITTSTSSSALNGTTVETTISSMDIAVSTSLSPASNPLETAAAGSSGLSTGAAAGVGVGASLGVILAAAIAGFVYYQRRRQAGTPTQQQMPDPQPTEGLPPQGPKPMMMMPMDEYYVPESASKYGDTPAAVEMPTHREPPPAELGL